MGFIDSYKHLEKLCGEIMQDNRKISAYIDEMENTPRGAYLVRGWNEDLKKLKRYRWIRNQIVHEPDCFEEEMCGPEDTLWLEAFYSRIMNQKDPLALYYEAASSCPKPEARSASADGADKEESDWRDTKERLRNFRGWRICLAVVFFLILVIFLWR